MVLRPSVLARRLERWGLQLVELSFWRQEVAELLEPEDF
jgi:hypothetical protein